MGLQLCTPVGSVIMYKFLIASCLAVATLASPEADAEASVAAWPSIRGYGLQSTCYGCRPYRIVHAIGKRSAEAEPHLVGYGYVRPVVPVVGVVGHSGYGVSQLHPGAASSFQSVTRLHKREAEAEAEADPYYGYGYSRLGYGHHLGYYGHGLGYYGRGYGYGHGYRYGYLG